MTGGNHTDWEKVPGFENLGFPVAEVGEDGEILITKVILRLFQPMSTISNALISLLEFV